VDDATLNRVVRQHAQTAQLLGVDFVPAYTGRSRNVSQRPSPPSTTPAEVTINVKPSVIEPPKAACSSSAMIPRGNLAAREQAMSALRAKYEADAPHQHFITAHTRLVWGEGSLAARLVFVGEAPGEEEDRQGRPFVGRSGQLLEKMILGMGLKREDVYICNVLKTRPPNNATPSTREIELCEPYLREQVAILAPDAIVTLGLPASRALLHTDESMTRMRGRWRTYALAEGHTVPLMPTFHPAYVLRNYTVETRTQVWNDLCQVMERLGLAPRANPAVSTT